MSTEPTDPDHTAPTDDRLTRYADVETGDGDLIVYDETVETAWVQSSEWIDLEFMR